MNWVRQSHPLHTALLALALLVSAAGVAAGQASPNFDLRISTLSGGGGRSQSTTAAVELTLASGGGFASSANALVALGYASMSTIAAIPSTADDYEADDLCPAAKPITINAPNAQVHSFHNEGDQDWAYFDAVANKTYIIEAKNVASNANAVIALYNDCATLNGSGDGSFGSTIRLEWDSTESRRYYVQFKQLDPKVFGDLAQTEYQIKVTIDGTPPTAPTNPRCEPKSPTTIGVQWKQSTQRDVTGYRILFAGNVSGSEDVAGKDSTYYELGGLTTDQTYQVRLQAVDFSGNESPLSGQFPCIPRQPTDTTQPTFVLSQPGGSGTIQTSASMLTFTGDASDGGGNLSRARVRNADTNAEGFDNSLAGSTDTFRVEDILLKSGDNDIQVSVIDAAGNTTVSTVKVTRLNASPGAVVIIAGHNESFGLQNNIYFAANRAYRVFQSAGYDAGSIFYLAPVNQDADGDGGNDVDAISTPANIEALLKGTSGLGSALRGKVNGDKPLFVYLIDHGFTEKFCAAGCTTGSFTPTQFDGWLRNLETAAGLTQVTVVMEACQSGSFLDREGDANSSLSKAGRVVITSTGRTNNAYASAQGAYFSDAFFSCLADSSDLKTCYNEGNAAVLTAGVAQTPWLDDNGDAVSNGSDGTVAQGRFVTKFFSSNRPVIVKTELQRNGANGVLSAQVNAGAEEIDIVWAAVFPPNFVEPQDVTLNLNVPTVRLEVDPNNEGSFSFDYVNGFPEEGDYRIVFYAQDRLGIGAVPRLVGEGPRLYLPIVEK